MATWNSRGLRGSTLEELINRTNEQYREKGLALIQKIPTPITPVRMDKENRHITLAYFEQRSTVDYIGAVQGIPVCFDAKECCFDTFPLMNIHSHQVEFMKEYREVIQYGTFYRLASPFEGNIVCWMCVSEDQNVAVVGWYKILNGVNMPFSRVRLQGLDEKKSYCIDGGESYSGSELMHIGLITSDGSAGELVDGVIPSCDFDSKVYVLKAR